jgi:hypothetical protein
MDFLHV